MVHVVAFLKDVPVTVNLNDMQTVAFGGIYEVYAVMMIL
jgi:hypothetical protein